MKRVLSIAICGLFLFGTAQARTCQYKKGEERWSVKTSVVNVNATAKAIDLGSLIKLKNPILSKDEKNNIAETRWTGDVAAKDDSGNDVTLHEGDVISVSGYIYRARCQGDGDYHLEIGTQSSRTNAKCLIVEVPDVSQIRVAALHAKVKGALQKLEGMDSSVFATHATMPPLPISITGQLFLDESHNRKNDPSGGRGTVLKSGKHCATNLWEIHPVTQIQ